MRRLISGVCLAFGLLLSQNAGARINVPDWVRQAASRPLGTYGPEIKTVVLLEQKDFTVLSAGEFLEHHRSVLKILRPDGRDDGALEVSLDGKDKLQSVHAWTIDSAGREYEVKAAEFTEQSCYPNWLLYVDDRSIVAKAPAPLPGSVIAFEYEVRRHRWINELGWRFQHQSPVAEALLTLQLPANWEYRAAWTGGKAIEPTALGDNRWQWTLKDLPGVADEPEIMMPAVGALARRMSISYFGSGEPSAHAGSWRAVGSWYAGLTDGRYTATPEIVAEAKELTSGKTDFASKLQALTSFVQSQIRYVAIEIGLGGEQPHLAGEVFRSRYGDCKDKVTLLKAMLQAIGVNSHYVLIDSDRGFIDPAVPSSWADHAIIAIELPESAAQTYRSVVTSSSGKRYLIFDPTDEYTPVGLLGGELQSSYALLVTENGGELIRTPLLPPESSQVARKGRFVLAADGKLAGEVSESRTGEFAARERARLRYTDQRKQTADFERWLGRSLQGFTLQNFAVKQGNPFAEDLEINYSFTAPEYAQSRGPLLLVRPRVLDEKSTHVERKPRHYPIELDHTTRQTDAYEIEIPSGYQVDDLPSATKIDVGFASYQSKFEAEGNKLRYWREYLVRDVSVAPERFADWVKLQGVIGADENAAAVLKKVQ